MLSYRAVLQSRDRALLIGVATYDVLACTTSFGARRIQPLTSYDIVSPILFALAALFVFALLVRPNSRTLALSGAVGVAACLFRAVIVLEAMMVNQLTVTTWAAWLSVGNYSVIAFFVAYVWLRILRPIVGAHESV